MSRPDENTNATNNHSTSDSSQTNVITFIHQNQTLPKFDGHNIAINTLLEEVDSEIKRTQITEDTRKIAALKSRIDYNDTLASDIIQSDAFLTQQTYEQFVEKFKTAFSKTRQLGSLSPLYTLAKSFNKGPYNTKERATKNASQTKADIKAALANSPWVHNDTLTLDNVASLFGYLTMLSQLHPDTLHKAATVPFNTTDTLVDYCGKLSDTEHTQQQIQKQVPLIQQNNTVAHIAHSNLPDTHNLQQQNIRGRQPSRSQTQRQRSLSRHNSFCTICNKYGHTTDRCYFRTPTAFCKYHKHCFHDTTQCRFLNTQYTHQYTNYGNTNKQPHHTSNHQPNMNSNQHAYKGNA